VGVVRSNRYLDFADIALGAKKSSSNKKKPQNDLSNAQKQPAQIHHHAEGKVTPINSRMAKLRSPNQGFGAFRNTR
jgi:hypothetical protein